MNPQTVASLMAEIEQEDPLDLANIAIDEADARRLMATHFCELDRKLADHGLGSDERLEMMAAIAAHTMVENLLLHVGRLKAREADDGKDVLRDWMRRQGFG